MFASVMMVMNLRKMERNASVCICFLLFLYLKKESKEKEAAFIAITVLDICSLLYSVWSIRDDRDDRVSCQLTRSIACGEWKVLLAAKP